MKRQPCFSSVVDEGGEFVRIQMDGGRWEYALIPTPLVMDALAKAGLLKKADEI